MAAPDSGWSVRAQTSDCSGSAAQGTASCYAYSNDKYENIDYTVTQNAETSDIQEVNTGFDTDYFYVEMDFVAAWNLNHSTGHQFVLEFDVDSDTESDRGDYYLGVFQVEEFNQTTWVDAYSEGGYEMMRDANDDVGGASVTSSDYGGSPGDGYETAVSQDADQVWARVVNGNFQVAIKRSVIGSPGGARLRPWSRQSTSLSKDKLYFHDQNSVSDVGQVDNIAGLGTGTWIPVGEDFEEADIVILKSGETVSDPVNMGANPKSIPGARVTYSVTVTNEGLGEADTNSVVLTDAVPTYTSLSVDDLGAPGSGPVLFTDGASSSGLTYTFISLSSTTDDVAFSNDGGLTFTYSPVADANGFDSAVTHLRITPVGAFQASDGTNHPSFQVQFQVGVH